MEVHFLKFIRRFEAMSGYFNLDLDITICVTNKHCIYFASHNLQLKPLKSFPTPSLLPPFFSPSQQYSLQVSLTGRYTMSLKPTRIPQTAEKMVTT